MQKLFIIILLVLVKQFAWAQENDQATIEVEVVNISSDDGLVVVGLYASEDQWLKKIKMGTHSEIEKGKAKVVFDNVPTGTYAISLFHDEDNDGKLDSLFGIPTEDTGSSNDAPAKFGPPKWEDAKFEVSGKTVKQIIKL